MKTASSMEPLRKGFEQGLNTLKLTFRPGVNQLLSHRYPNDLGTQRGYLRIIAG